MLPITRTHQVHVPHSLAVLAGVMLLITALIWDRADDRDADSAAPLQANVEQGDAEPAGRRVQVSADERPIAARRGKCADCTSEPPLSPLLLLELLPH